MQIITKHSIKNYFLNNQTEDCKKQGGQIKPNETKKINRLKATFIFSSFVLFLMGFTLWYNNVPTDVTAEDKIYIAQLMQELEIKPLKINRTFKDEIKFIQEVQEKIIKRFPHLETGIPLNQPREPKNLMKYGKGFCFDRSRTLEKIFKLSNFETVHLSLFNDISSYKSDFFTLFKYDCVRSHALSEVLTKNGWLICDSNFPFVAIDIYNKIYSYKDLKIIYDQDLKVNWQTKLPESLFYFYNGGSEYVYGLYSRHGKFYPPYNFIPDVNLKEILFNFKKSTSKI